MFTKRIIPCLDVNKGRVVKGINFVNLRDAGDPVEIAAAYDKAGADEVVFLDITASSDNRNTVVDMVRKVAENVFIPFTVGGGIRTVDDFKALLREGADKISINSSAINTPQLISDAADKFGSQCVVVAIDARKRTDGSGWNVYKNGGRIDTGLDAIEWAIKADKMDDLLFCGDRIQIMLQQFCQIHDQKRDLRMISMIRRLRIQQSPQFVAIALRFVNLCIFLKHADHHIHIHIGQHCQSSCCHNL